MNKPRVPGQNGICQAWYVVKIHHSSPEPSKQANKQINK